MSKIYGVDTDKPITPLMVRDAMIECFFQAHCADTEVVGEDADESVNKSYCRSIVKKAFKDSGDFENPTKQSIMNAMENLAEFAKNFRNPEIIKKHSGEIMALIEKLK